MQSERAYLALGANLGPRAESLRRAVAALGAIAVVEAISAVYETEPAYILDQPRFYNLALSLQTRLGPFALLRALKAIESDLGRLPGVRYGARALDLDVLVFGDIVMDTPDLTIPHPRLAERAFVLVPLAEIAPGLSVLGRGATVSELLAALGDVSTQVWRKGALAELDLEG